MNVGIFRSLELTIVTLHKILNINITISGSFALYMLGLLKPGRKVKDLDLVFSLVDLPFVLDKLNQAGIRFYQCHYELTDSESIYFQCEINNIKVDLIFKDIVKTCNEDTITMDNSRVNLYKEIVIPCETLTVKFNKKYHAVENMDFMLSGHTIKCLIHDPMEIMSAKVKLVKQNDFGVSELLKDHPKKEKIIKHLRDCLYIRKVMKKRHNKDVYTIVNNEGEPMSMDCKVEIDGIINVFKNVPIEIKPKKNSTEDEVPWQD